MYLQEQPEFPQRPQAPQVPVMMAEENPAKRIRLIMKLRRHGITDTSVLSAIESVPREMFVADSFADKAYEDMALPIASGQTISQPTVVAWMTYALNVTKQTRVLEIGTGSGYQAAILSKLARRVYTVERHRELLRQAEERFTLMGLNNITSRCGDGSKGWKEPAPFERILVTAAAPTVPAALLEQLAPGGIMVLPVGAESGEQILLRVIKDADGNVQTEHLMNVRFVPLVEGMPAKMA